MYSWKSVDLYFLSLQYKVKTSQPTVGFRILISKCCTQIAHGSTYKLRGEEENEDSDDDQEKTNVHVPCSTPLIDLQRGEYNIIYAHPWNSA